MALEMSSIGVALSPARASCASKRLSFCSSGSSSPPDTIFLMRRACYVDNRKGRSSLQQCRGLGFSPHREIMFSLADQRPIKKNFLQNLHPETNLSRVLVPYSETNQRQCSLDTRDIRSCRAALGTFSTFREETADKEDFIKAGGEELDYVELQASKNLKQAKIVDKLQPLKDGALDLVVIGCGPAGMCLAAEAAKQGLSVGLVGPDLPFVNNYGVWEDEFQALGLEKCIEQTWRDSTMYIEGDTPVMIGRAYGRVSRELLREELLKRCADAGVEYLDSTVERILDIDETQSTVICRHERKISCRLVTVASGAAAGRFLNYEPGGPGVGVQTAYGMEVEVEHYPYDADYMLFMDYRDYKVQDQETGASQETPTFLYAMPLSSTRIFFEETCLAARPAMPFSLLRERLLKRLEKMGIKVGQMYEEEWSYVPVGGNLPVTTQQHLGFGAAANMVHPATGYSVVRSLSEAPLYAAAIACALKKNALVRGGENSRAASLEAWNALWPRERKRERAFFLFGLELILQLDSAGIREFFVTFFRLPEWLWKGFLGSKLSSVDLIWFALATFVVAPNRLRFRLVKHLIVDPSGANLVQTYAGLGARNARSVDFMPVGNQLGPQKPS